LKGFKEPVREWMEDNVGKAFHDWSPMAVECANNVGCSMITSDRWIVQLSSRSGPFRMVRNDDGDLVIQRRG